MNGQKKVWHYTKMSFSKIVFSRFFITLLLLAAQIFVLAGVLLFLGENAAGILGSTSLLAFLMCLYLANAEGNPTVKITWIILIMLIPIFAVPLYFYIKSDLGFRVIRRKLEEIYEATAAWQKDAGFAEQSGLAAYLKNCGGFPAYNNTEVTYFPSGEEKFAEMLVQLESAEKFIFLEYFIIDDGFMWSAILDVLKRKAASNVEVRVMYDGTCAFTTLPYSYPGNLKAFNIDCKMYAPIRPFVSTLYNNRDHRKILVIDGHTAFTGGVNLADEYINKRERFGHWKDAAIMLKGEAVKSFSAMFLQLWNIDRELTAENYEKYLTEDTRPQTQAKGTVIPYGDSPFDEHTIGKMVYIHILNQAKDYVHIMTPYLILDDETQSALCFAARRGVMIKLILPHIPDKKTAFALAKSHYKTLLKSGVQIYEYSPGFVHAKVFVSDSIHAVVGTINLDYRSLYHHFECAAYLHGVDAVTLIKKDVDDTLRLCKRITFEDVRKERLGEKLYGAVLKLIAPLM